MASKLAWPVNDKQLNKETNLVGAAGFEPTTCSTQNCRATRLRYTPIFYRKRCGYTVGRTPARLAVSTPVEQRVRPPVARLDPVFLRRSCDHFKHALRQPARRDDPSGFRFGIFGDPQDPPVGADENHVERDVG